MSEHEKRLGALLEKMKAAYPRTAREAVEAFATVLAERRAALSSARDAALGEAERIDLYWLCKGDQDSVRERIRALKSRPAERFIPEAEVREAALGLLTDSMLLDDPLDARAMFLSSLGVDLDAAPAEDAADPAMCWKDCGANHPVTEPCQPRETATEENAILPARRDAEYRKRLEATTEWRLRIYDSRGRLWHRETGSEHALRRQGRTITTLKGQKSWKCDLFDGVTGKHVATCKRGVWKDVSDPAGKVKP